MSRQNRLNAVATTALVAAFPVFPLFADEPSPTNDAASQAVATEVASDAETLAPPDANAAFADFNVSLFEIPDGESAEFYRKRADEIEREWSRLAQLFSDKQEEFARKTKPNVAFNQAEKIDYAPIGTIPADGRFVPAPPDSVPGRRAVALADLYGRLADAPELPFEVRGLYYQNWLRVLNGSLEGKSTVEKRDFYAKILAAEEAKSPLDLGRVIALRAIVKQYDVYAQEAAKPRQDAELQKPNDRADVEKLLDVPEGKSVDYYRTHLGALTYAVSIARQEKDKTLQTRVREAVDLAQKRYAEALKAEAAAFDRDAVKKLLDVPQGESAEFYLELYDKIDVVWGQVSAYCKFQEYGDLGRLEVQIRRETLPEINKRLAYADDLEPFERFQRLTRWLYFADVEETRSALEAEIARDETSEIDACREPYVRCALLQKRVEAVATEARKALPPEKRNSYPVQIPPLSSEIQAELAALADDIAALADNGAQPWELGGSWAKTAAGFAAHVAREIHLDAAKPIYKEIYAVIANSENETERQVCRELKRNIDQAEFLGSAFEVPGRDLDGNPIDWKRFRGAPVLLVAGGVDATYAPGHDRDFLPKCVDAGLQIVRYCADLESARRLSIRDQEDTESFKRLKSQGFNPFVGATSFAGYVVPLASRGPGDWPYEHGIVWLKFAVLFDADGRVLATSPRLLHQNNAPEIADELRRLFPDVPVAERK